MSVMTVAPCIDFEGALGEADPVQALRDAVAAEVRDGADRADLYRLLMDQMLRYRGAGREDAEDVVADVMDFLAGFCSPHARI
jgi:hypothetical protein